MFRASLGLIGAAAITLAARSASAQDWFYYGPSSGHYYRHERLHDDFDYRAYERHLEHREAHRYPMTWRQHDQLHDELGHEAYHDRRAHRSWHRRNDYRYSGGGFSFGGGRTRIYVGW